MDTEKELEKASEELEEAIKRVPQLSQKELEKRFNYHPADTEEKKQAHEQIRNMCLRYATDIKNLIPEGREQALALTHLEEVMFWANAGIARNS